MRVRSVERAVAAPRRVRVVLRDATKVVGDDEAGQLEAGVQMGPQLCPWPLGRPARFGPHVDAQMAERIEGIMIGRGAEDLRDRLTLRRAQRPDEKLMTQ